MLGDLSISPMIEILMLILVAKRCQASGNELHVVMHACVIHKVVAFPDQSIFQPHITLLLIGVP